MVLVGELVLRCFVGAVGLLAVGFALVWWLFWWVCSVMGVGALWYCGGSYFVRLIRVVWLVILVVFAVAGFGAAFGLNGLWLWSIVLFRFV